MRVAVFVTRFPAVSETFVLRQVEGLIRRGHDVRIFARRPGEGTELLDPSRRAALEDRTTWFDLDETSRWKRIRSAVAALTALSLRRPGRASRLVRLASADHDPLTAPAVRLARALVREPRFDAVLCHFGPNGRLAALLDESGLLRAPFATVFHGYDLTSHPRGRGDSYYARLFRRGASFLPVSERFATLLEEAGCPRDRILVHHMGIDGVDMAWSEPGPVGREVRLVTIARMVEKKGIRHAIVALARLDRDGIAARYVVVGDGPARADIEAEAAALGVAERLEITGWAASDQVAAHLRAADVLLAPSVTAISGDEEGIPVVLMEAMACGVPVIASRHGGIPELVRDGETGLLVDEGDADGLAAAVVRLTRDLALRRRLSRAARDLVASEFETSILDRRLDEHLSSLESPSS